jgi:hypothetical protein
MFKSENFLLTFKKRCCHAELDSASRFAFYSERFNKVVIARSEATWQSHEIASLRSQ